MISVVDASAKLHYVHLKLHTNKHCELRAVSQLQRIMVGIAMLGAGIIVGDCYLPLFKKYCNEWKLHYVWSRTAATAQKVLPTVAEFNSTCKVESGDDGLKRVLGDTNVSVVIIALPAQAQLAVVKEALAAGKHVLEEKPIGPTLLQAVQALEAYGAKYSAKLLWGVAENYRSEDVFLRAREVVKDIGKVIKVDLIADMPMPAASKYFSSAWRRDTSAFPGGFIVDGGVHYIAAMRTIAREAGLGEVVQAVGTCRVCTDALPPPDTLVGTVQFADGTPGSISFSYSAAQVRFSLSFVGTKGSLEVQRGGWGISRGEYTLQYKRDTDKEPVKEPFKFTGFENELRSFISCCQVISSGGVADKEHEYRTSCVEAARDLAVLGGMLESAQWGPWKKANATIWTRIGEVSRELARW